MVKVTGSPRTNLSECAAISSDALCACFIAVPVLTTSACPTIKNKTSSPLIPFSYAILYRRLYYDPIRQIDSRIQVIRPAGNRYIVPAYR